MKNMENRKYYTLGLDEESCNFCIENLLGSNNEKFPDRILILEKVLHKGMLSKATKFLSNKLENNYPKEKRLKNIKLIDDKIQKWTNLTIKGNSNNLKDNPAYKLYKDISSLLKGFQFLNKLIIPECKISSFFPQISEVSSLNKDSTVDFYIPDARIIIEVDGQFHTESESQKNIDKERDNLLKHLHIKVFRVPTKFIREETKEYSDFKKELILFLGNNINIQHYKSTFDNKLFLQEQYYFSHTAIIRFQVLLLELIKKNILSLEDKSWNLEIFSDFISKFDWVKVALDDFFNLLSPISNLYGDTFIKPKINYKTYKYNKVTEKSKNIKIMFSLFSKYDESKPDYISLKSTYIQTICYKTRGSRNNTIFRWGVLSNFFATPKVNKKNINLSDELVHKSLKIILKEIYDYNSFKEGQEEIIEKIFKNQTCLGLLPTGGGKSLCFQLTSLLRYGTSIVVCPIISLMRDHKEELDQLGFNRRVGFISANQEKHKREITIQRFKEGQLNFIFISPERFQTEEFRNILIDLNQTNLIQNIILDEVHCLSEWGHDFRPSYLSLVNTITNAMKIKVPIISLTATASLAVLKDLQVELNLNDENIVYKMLIGRKELTFDIKQIDSNTKKTISIDKHENKYQELLNFLKNNKPSKKNAGLIFTPHVNGNLGCYPLRRDLLLSLDIDIGIFSGDEPNDANTDINNNLYKDCDFFKKKNSNKSSISFYEQYKTEIQDKFKNNELSLMIATKSFGMGINKKNIRFTVHYGMPASMEAFYQEAGRAGRDGEESHCKLLFTEEHDGIPSDLHDKNLNINKLKGFPNSTEKNKRGDFRTQLWLLASKIYSVSEDAKACELLINKLFESNRGVAEVYQKREVIIYRLFQLGIVKDWLVKDFFGGTYLVKYKKIDVAQISKNIFNKIAKYSPSNEEVSKHKNNLGLILKENNNPMKDLITYLLRWNYEHFVYNRRQSLKNLYENCQNFKNIGAKRFKVMMDQYFAIDSISININKHLDNSFTEAIDSLESTLFKDSQLVDNDYLLKTQTSLSRFLEAYQDNPWLNILSAFCRLLNNDFNDLDGKDRFISFINSAKKNEKNWQEVKKKILNLGVNLDDDKKILLSNTLVDSNSRVEEIIDVYDILEDKNSLLLYIEKANNRFKKVKYL